MLRLVPIDRAYHVSWCGAPAAIPRTATTATITTTPSITTTLGPITAGAMTTSGRLRWPQLMPWILSRAHARGLSVWAAVCPVGGSPSARLTPSCLGHWWYEGGAWLAYVVEECAAQGLELVRLDDALERLEPAPAQGIWRDPEQVSTWGERGTIDLVSRRQSRRWPSPCVPPNSPRERAGSGLRSGGAAPAALLLQSSTGLSWSPHLAVPYARAAF